MSEKNTNAPSPRRTTLAILSLGLGTFAQVTAEFLPVGLLPAVSQQFQVTSGTAGLMMTLPGIMAAISAALVSIVAGSLDRKHVLLAMAGVLGLSSLFCAFAPSFPVLLLGRALLGISLGASWALSLSVAGKVVPAEKVHSAAAAVFAGVTGAMVLGLPLGSYIASTASWRYAFGVSAALGFAVLVLQAVALPPIRVTTRFGVRDYLTFIRSPGAKASLTIILLGHAAHFGTYTFLSPALDEVGIQGGMLTSVLVGFGVVGFAANYFTAKYVASSTFGCLLAMQLLLAAALICIPLGENPWLRLAGVTVWAVAWGGLPLSLNIWNRAVGGGGGEAGSALFILTAQAAIAIGSGLGGKVFDNAGLPADFLLWGILSLVGAAIATAAKTSQAVSVKAKDGVGCA